MPCATDASSAVQDLDPGATIDAWRARGDHRFDPIRFRFIEVLARRAAVHHGDVRRILDDRLHTLLAAYGEDLARAQSADGTVPSRVVAPEGPTPRGPLAALVEHAALHASFPGDRAAGGAVASGLASAPPELKSVRYFRSTWSKLSADRRLTQSLAKVPDNAGPLNSHYLVHRSLTLMRELSPAYLDRFMSYVDALLWIDQANGASALPGGDAPRAESPRKTARGKSG